MKAAMLWSGGKDSCLALHRALERGVDFACLATFTPADDHEFFAHPRWMMAKQASAIGLPHFCLPVSEAF